MTTLDPTLVDGMTSAELAAAVPELVSACAERIAVEGGAWRDWSVRWLDAWDRHDLDAILDLVTDDVRYEDPSLFGEFLTGRAALREVVLSTWQAFPDVRFELPAPRTPLFRLVIRMQRLIAPVLRAWHSHRS